MCCFSLDKVVQSKEGGDVTSLCDGFVSCMDWNKLGNWALCMYFCVLKEILAMRPLTVP